MIYCINGNATNGMGRRELEWPWRVASEKMATWPRVSQAIGVHEETWRIHGLRREGKVFNLGMAKGEERRSPRGGRGGWSES